LKDLAFNTFSLFVEIQKLKKQIKLISEQLSEPVVCLIKHDVTDEIYRIGLDNEGIYVEKNEEVTE